MHRSCVRRAAPGERIDEHGVVTHANGAREQLPPCRYPRLNLHTLQPIASGARVAPSSNGWVEDTTWTSTVALGSLSATFVVPPLPTPSNDATIFFFPAAETNDGATILQPVLQYGQSDAGGGNYWSAASWILTASTTTISSSMPVSAGDTISGTMTSACSGSNCNWSVVTTDVTSNTTVTAEATLTTAVALNFGGVLETYQVTACNQLPSSGTITFTGITLQDQNGNPLQPAWFDNTYEVTPSCNYAVQHTSSTATLTY
jgi:hypothetical protein